MKLWLAFVIGAGLCWGTYVPLIFYGGKSLSDGSPGLGNRFAAILCVGAAYFLLGVVFPLAWFWMNGTGNAHATFSGITFSSLAGIAGAAGAICVVFATSYAAQDKEFVGARLFIAPLIFGMAPLINTLVSLVWHPSEDAPWHFAMPTVTPHWTLYLGIVLTGLGAALVLYSKEATEELAKKAGKPAAVLTPQGQHSGSHS